MDGELELEQFISTFEGLTDDLWLGDRWSGGRAFDGLIDDLQIYDSALSEDEARFLFENPGATIGGVPVLRAGDADQDLDFDQLDVLKVQIAGKYLTGEAATWGEGDWDGAPGGTPGSPPAGNGQFDQLDIIAALAAGTYLTGPYGALGPAEAVEQNRARIGYDARTGELWLDAEPRVELTSVDIHSASGIFTGDPAQGLGGSFDRGTSHNIFKATFGSSFGSVTFGNVARPGLPEQFIRQDLTATASLAGGGQLDGLSLIYVPEPAAAILLSIGLWLSAVGWFKRQAGA